MRDTDKLEKSLRSILKLRGVKMENSLPKRDPAVEIGPLTWSFYMTKLAYSETTLEYQEFLEQEFPNLQLEYLDWIDGLFDDELNGTEE